jgi:hypothetical protein
MTARAACAAREAGLADFQLDKRNSADQQHDDQEQVGANPGGSPPEQKR